jgi:hypothetical protein
MLSLFGYGDDTSNPISPQSANSDNSFLSSPSLTSPSSTVSTTPTTPALDTPTHLGLKPKYSSPPLVKKTYRKSEALDDIKGVSYALELFLGSKMVEAEEYCHKSDENKCVFFVGVWGERVLTYGDWAGWYLQGTVVLRDGVWAYSVCEGVDVV